MFCFHYRLNGLVILILSIFSLYLGFPGGSVAKELSAVSEMQEMQVWSLGQEDPLEEEMTTHCSILAWKIPWTEEPGGLQSMGSQRVGYDRVTKHTLIHTHSL